MDPDYIVCLLSNGLEFLLRPFYSSLKCFKSEWDMWDFRVRGYLDIVYIGNLEEPFH